MAISIPETVAKTEVIDGRILMMALATGRGSLWWVPIGETRIGDYRPANEHGPPP
jgi:hypothetical protein